MSSPIPPGCICGHQKVDHISSRGRSLRGARWGRCLVLKCDCREYEPVQARLPGTEPEALGERAQAVTFGARASGGAYRDRDHYDLARDLEAEKEPDERER